MAYRLSDSTKKLMIDHLQKNLPAALTAVANDTKDGKVSLNAPKVNSYFQYPFAKAYDAPAIFVITEDFDFRFRERGQNHINAAVTVHVNVVVEDKTLDLLVLKADRYLDAIFSCLNNTHIDDKDQKVRLIIVVNRATFTPEYTDAGVKGSSQGVFRKEVHFECEVQHFTNAI